MPRQITVVTPENVRLEYELAGVASRTGAAVMDMLLQGLVMGILAGGVFGVMYWLKLPVTTWVTGVLIVSEFLLFWGYYIYFETAWNGQTPGKRSMRLRTVREGGLPINFSCAAIRNLIRVFDIHLIGFVMMLVTGKNQRLGDLAAGTLVVKERAEWLGDLEAPKAAVTTQYAEGAYVKNIELVTPQEFAAVQRFLDRRHELQPALQTELAAKIAKPLMARLGIEDHGVINYANLLSEISRRCTDERGMR